MNWKKQEAQLPVGRSQQINGGLVIRNIKKEDAGIYICAATIAKVFNVETVTTIDVLPSKGKQGLRLLRVWMGLTDKWQMAKILTERWQIA